MGTIFFHTPRTSHAPKIRFLFCFFLVNDVFIDFTILTLFPRLRKIFTPQVNNFVHLVSISKTILFKGYRVPPPLSQRQIQHFRPSSFVFQIFHREDMAGQRIRRRIEVLCNELVIQIIIGYEISPIKSSSRHS